MEVPKADGEESPRPLRGWAQPGAGARRSGAERQEHTGTDRPPHQYPINPPL